MRDSYSNRSGSIWRRWDLHFHTPSSFDYKDKGQTNAQIIDGLISAGIEAVVITEHHRIDATRIADLQHLAADRLTILPGIELRSELGGSETVHYIGIFSENIDVSDLWTKLSGRLNITEMDVQKRGDESVWCAFETTSAIIHELGGLVSVHAGSKANSIENMSNANRIKRVIKKEYVDNGSIDFLEIGKVADEEEYRRIVLPQLNRKVPIIICSDNHNIANYEVRCPLWIKGDRTFEALRQTLFEPSRVSITVERPIEPIIAIREVVLDFPVETLLVTEAGSEKRSDKFCFSGKTTLTFSPYFTCLIGGRGSGKSTLLNLLHEKLNPGKTKYFKANRLEAGSRIDISTCIEIDSDVAHGSVEFLQQNEIEQFATAPSGLTAAVFSRLKKRDPGGTLQAVEIKVQNAVAELDKHSTRLVTYQDLASTIALDELDLSALRTLVASFENPEYVSINRELRSVSSELQSLQLWRTRLGELIVETEELYARHQFPPSDAPNEYESDLTAMLALFKQSASPLSTRGSLQHTSATEEGLRATSLALNDQMRAFLKGRGLSPENLSELGNANQGISVLEQELPAQKARVVDLQLQIDAFKVNRQLIDEHVDAVSSLLTELNANLSNLSSEVKAIGLRYEFDKECFVDDMTNHIQDLLRQHSTRSHHLRSMLEEVSYEDLTTIEDFVAKIPEKQATGKLLRDYFSNELNFRLLQVESEKRLLNFDAYWKIHVSYDGKPIEKSSFGQRCTAAIVILLLLGNTPIVIDEPEAHLDSALIANYLVELVKTKKLERQVIFATHNANFVVNGDAELIHCLEMNDERVTQILSATIEDERYRDRLLALEGGPEAFQKREHKYGIH